VHNILQLETVGICESAFKQRLGNIETNKIVEVVEGVSVFRHLHHIETELGFNSDPRETLFQGSRRT
jgi:hypothetical protein